MYAPVSRTKKLKNRRWWSEMVTGITLKVFWEKKFPVVISFICIAVYAAL